MLEIIMQRQEPTLNGLSLSVRHADDHPRFRDGATDLDFGCAVE